jgi:hypothetical protein
MTCRFRKVTNPTLSANSSQEMAAAIIAMKMVLAMTPGRIQGLPTQIGETEFSVEPFGNV